MKQPITGFHKDEHGDWVADFERNEVILSFSENDCITAISHEICK